MPSGSPATDFSVALLGEFLALGVRDIVLSPGARSQALALAAAEYERAGLVSLRVRIDERVGGFLALGLAVESRLPILIITTSGTAVANLHPAVLEAHHSGVPLILLTADRPLELRGIGSNQTTDQPGIFGSAVHFVRDIDAPTDAGFTAEYPGELAREAFAAAAGHSSAPGPVQVNLAFREPLSAAAHVASLSSPLQHASPVAATSAAALLEPLLLEPAAGTIVIAGHGAGPQAERLARELGAPLLAEVTSGARFGPNLVVSYRELLGDDRFARRVRRAVVFGHPTLTREVPELLRRTDVQTIVVRGPGFEPYNPGHLARVVDAVAYAGGPAERSWAGSWVHTSRALLEPETAAGPDPLDSGRAAVAASAKAQLAAFRAPVTRRALVEAVWNATWPHDRLVFGASRLIRDADRVVPGKKISVHANRGLAGIDGTIATSVGIALASERHGESGTTRALLGDLTLLHDVGALLFGTGEPRPRVQVIVGNDGGGTIFDGLEVAGTAPHDAIDRVLYTPHSVDIRSLAAAYGWNHVLVSNRGELDEALAPPSGPTIVEVVLPRRE
ncbi:MAG: 2-succinyl-5-enolpyruvyl-6-hydroxy-3-cyclohexene-1-carboxylic-acid synthase [Burkholderiaceae bacterium]|nr:2-succinyl-5-enolpyruvyl-6-hydroxy-3-cyclohexene-1-carboxylic-acid synthase [Microbacteriaceae bacterium]